MIKETEIKLKPEDLNEREILIQKIRRKLNVSKNSSIDFKIIRKSIDARRGLPQFVLRVQAYIDEVKATDTRKPLRLNVVEGKEEAIIIGAGPAGYFAALQLIELGIKPIVYERGKDVQKRRRDLRQIQQFSKVDPNSNYCFGEGGAGTYSDGKLYTRAKKRGDVKKVLEILVDHGASSDIEIDAHPHIGSNKLPKIISSIRAKIISKGGEIHFEKRLTDIIISGGKLTGIVINGEQIVNKTCPLILATGHSARDIFYMLDKHNLSLTFKDFALGVRIEHPQAIVDEIQYNIKKRSENLPAAEYRLACQVGGKGVFSFCMCPGGLIVPAATAPGEIVLNGMSLSKRDSPFANAGVVTSLNKEDVGQNPEDPFAGLKFQQQIEQSIFNFGDGSQKAPTQRLTDFVNGTLSTDLNRSSYIPGIYSAPVHELLPHFISQRLKNGIKMFEKRMRGYLTSEANILAVESRTSSPIRIPRDAETDMHPDLLGLFPCGEGGGYAGGIMSAALDGQRVAKSVAVYINEN